MQELPRGVRKVPVLYQESQVFLLRLRFEEKPDYPYLRNMFKELFQKSNYKFDYQYDWVILGEIKDKADKKVVEEPKEEPKDI